MFGFDDSESATCDDDNPCAGCQLVVITNNEDSATFDEDVRYTATLAHFINFPHHRCRPPIDESTSQLLVQFLLCSHPPWPPGSSIIVRAFNPCLPVSSVLLRFGQLPKFWFQKLRDWIVSHID